MSEALKLDDWPTLLTPDEVCQIVRKQVRNPAKAVRGMQKRGLRILEEGRHLLVLRRDLEAYIAALADGDGQ